VHIAVPWYTALGLALAVCVFAMLLGAAAGLIIRKIS